MRSRRSPNCFSIASNLDSSPLIRSSRRDSSRAMSCRMFCPQPAIAGQDQPGQGRPYCQDRKATRANALEKELELAFFYLLRTSSMIQ